MLWTENIREVSTDVSFNGRDSTNESIGRNVESDNQRRLEMNEFDSSLEQLKHGSPYRYPNLIPQFQEFAVSHYVAHLVQSIHLEYGEHGSRVGQALVRVLP